MGAWRSDEKIDASQITFDGTVTVTSKLEMSTAAQLGYVVAVHNQDSKKMSSKSSACRKRCTI